MNFSSDPKFMPKFGRAQWLAIVDGFPDIILDMLWDGFVKQLKVTSLAFHRAFT